MASFTFNGLNSETDYDLRIHDVLYNVLPQTIDHDVKVPYGRGRYDYGTYLDSNTIGFVCSLQGTSYADVFTQVEAIAAWLNPELGVFELSYSGKPNRHCYAKISGNTSVKQILLYGKFTVIFKIPEGVWYGDEVNWTSNEATLEDEEVGSIFTTPSDMAEGAMKADLSGMTVSEVLNNGNFVDGSNWSFGTGYSIVSNQLSCNVSSANALAINTLRTPTVNGDKYAFLYDVVSYTSGTIATRASANAFGSVSLPISTTGRKAVILTASSVVSVFTLVSSDAVCILDNLTLINISAMGLSTLTAGDALTMFPHYIDGTVHAGATRFTSVGKNLFTIKDKVYDVTINYQPSQAENKSVYATYDVVYGMSRNAYMNKDVLLLDLDTTTGSFTYTTSQAYYGVGVKVKVSPKTAYVFSFSGDGGGYVGFFKSDGTFISDVTTRNFTTPANCAFVFLVFCSRVAGTNTITVSNMQLELGSTATTYEPYHDTHTTGTLPELRRLPNGIRDTYDLNTGVKVQRVSGAYTLQNADIGGVVVSSNVSIAICKLFSNQRVILGGSAKLHHFLILNKEEVTYSSINDVSHIGKFAFGDASGVLVFVIPKFTSLEDARTALAGTVIYYQLATPVKSYVDPELENQDDEAVNFLLGGPSYTVNIDIDGCPSPMTQYGTMEVIENDGGLSTEGVIEITCDFNTSFLEIKLDDSDEFIRIEDTFLINDVIEINLNTGSVTKNGMSILDKVTLASTLFDGTFKIPRGTSLLSLHGASELILVFEEKWL